jgi:hypothetical protein
MPVQVGHFLYGVLHCWFCRTRCSPNCRWCDLDLWARPRCVVSLPKTELPQLVVGSFMNAAALTLMLPKFPQLLPWEGGSKEGPACHQISDLCKLVPC